MPIRYPTNNRVLNNNARAVDVAQLALERAADIQARKMDSAFQVNGYTGILYRYLTNGTPCACKAKSRSINARLDLDGKASTGDLNEMLNPNNQFGVRPYGERTASTPAYIAQAKTGYSALEVNIHGGRNQPIELFDDVFDESDIDTANRRSSGLQRVVQANTGSSDQANLIVDVDPSTLVTSLESDFDLGLYGMTDASCAVCFGSGFVGGYAVMDGFRQVLTYQSPSFATPRGGIINIERDTPSITTERARWTVVLPKGARICDAVRVWNGTKQIPEFTITINPDGNDPRVLSKASDILLHCTGRPVVIELRFPDSCEFTHLEIQCGQSTLNANFELPKLSKNSDISLRETTDPFQVLLSPRIPLVRTLDILVESTYGRALQVKSVSGLNDRRYSTLGWEVDVRPCQPQEMFSLLPRRKLLSHMNKPSIVRDNQQINGFTRT